MFGHLKAEEFINLIEGTELPLKSRSHLQACSQCTHALASAQRFHADMTKSVINDEEIPEPDWFQFRADVRNRMLSRAAQRQAPLKFWSGWMLRPAMSLGLAVAFVAGLSAGLLIWNRTGTNGTQPEAENVGTVQFSNANVEDAGLTSEQVASLDSNNNSTISNDEAGVGLWSQSSVFEQLSQLNDDQALKLQRLLEADAGLAPTKQ